MMKNIIVFLVLSLVIGAFCLLPLGSAAKAAPLNFADAQTVVCDGATLVTGGDCDPATGSAVQTLIKNITSIFAWLLGIIAVFLIMLGGFKYVTSGGDSGKVSSAKNTILFAIVGLVIAAISQPFINFVIGFFTE